MKQLTIGVTAHVDSGKTTLSEAMLYRAGDILRAGRVDHGDAFLDTDAIEKDRGITIFSKIAMLHLKNTTVTLLDTPGHVDFSAETERTFGVLDYAILVISGSDGVQSHTETLWKLLGHYGVPVFIFVNKMDIASRSREDLLAELRTRLDGGCLDFETQNETFYENAAMQSEDLLEEYMASGTLKRESLIDGVRARHLFPCFFGSALRFTGIEEFLSALDEYTAMWRYRQEFGARVFKIAEDEKGTRLTYMKITGGSLPVKTLVGHHDWQQKVNELRLVSGTKYTPVAEASAGMVVAAAGLTKTYPGEGLGFEEDAEGLRSEPVFTYAVELPENVDVYSALAMFRRLEQEETQMHVVFHERLQTINVQIMGEVQLEVLTRVLAERFSLNVTFHHGSILYKETIKNPIEGVGHYEPLRHYAEVHLLLEPGERGSGLVFKTNCSENELDRNWQRLILSHLAEKTHIGVLTGSPLTDLVVTLVSGRAHLKHTEGGDFRQATYRALRQGLMMTENVLLEPFFSFTLEVPTENAGRAMTDLTQKGASFGSPEISGGMTVLTGSAPVSSLRDYPKEVIAYTRGKGRLSCAFKDYEPCVNADEAIAAIGYRAEADLENTADSVFCAHGGGFLVKWNEVRQYMHLPLIEEKKDDWQTAPVKHHEFQKLVADEEELLRIFEQTYGRIRRPAPERLHTPKEPPKYKGTPVPTGPIYLLIDGYNIMFAWDDLKEIASVSLEDARKLLIDRLCNYQAMTGLNVILVFDAYKVKGSTREIERIHGITVVYTKEAETADSYIQKTSKELCRNYRVRVATSDSAEQIIVFGNGAVRVSAPEFQREVLETENEIRQFIRENNTD